MKDKMPLVSVIIPTYNRVDLVSDAVNSVLNQTYRNIELIVVDDGSTDNTKEVLLAYGKRIKYFYKHNDGNANARNYGVNKARGKYIAFLDHDDIWHPERLEKLIGYIERNNHYSAIISEVEFVDIDCKTLSYSNYKDGFPVCEDALSYALKNLLDLFSNLIIKRDTMLALGEIDESLKAASDIDFYLRIAAKYKIALYGEPLLKYRKTDTSFSNKLFTKNRLNVLSKFKTLYPELSKKHENIIKNTTAKIHLNYADDLLWHRYIKEARSQLSESLHNHFTLKAVELFVKSLAIELFSVILPEYRDKGRFGGI